MWGLFFVLVDVWFFGVYGKVLCLEFWNFFVFVSGISIDVYVGCFKNWFWRGLYFVYLRLCNEFEMGYFLIFKVFVGYSRKFCDFNFERKLYE